MEEMTNRELLISYLGIGQNLAIVREMMERTKELETDENEDSNQS